MTMDELRQHTRSKGFLDWTFANLLCFCITSAARRSLRFRIRRSFVALIVAQNCLPWNSRVGRLRMVETKARASSGDENLKWTALVSRYGASAGMARVTPACYKNSFAMLSASSSGVFSPMPPRTATLPSVEVVPNDGGADAEEDDDADAEAKREESRLASASIFSSNAAYWFRATVPMVFVDRSGWEESASSLASTLWNCSSWVCNFACTIGIFFVSSCWLWMTTAKLSRRNSIMSLSFFTWSESLQARRSAARPSASAKGRPPRRDLPRRRAPHLRIGRRASGPPKP
mmetsp:Transcript_48222/g.135718  ORF Transcript_48222/g.135718 Transcript_48222/m.135718 type:complete len:289 (+) Transcript_48222:1037-1903(+)